MSKRFKISPEWQLRSLAILSQNQTLVPVVTSETSIASVNLREFIHSNLLVIPPNSNTFYDWRRTCQVLRVKTNSLGK